MFTAFVVQVLPVGIYDTLLFSTPDELRWIRFGEWKVADSPDAAQFAYGEPAEYRDGEPFVRYFFDVQLRQYRFKMNEDDREFSYRSHMEISINVPRATIAATILAAFWILGWFLWLRLVGPRRLTESP